MGLSIVPNETYLTDRDICQRFGVKSRATPWRWSARADLGFPRPVKLTDGCTRWRLSEIEAWERERGEAA